MCLPQGLIQILINESIRIVDDNHKTHCSDLSECMIQPELPALSKYQRSSSRRVNSSKRRRDVVSKPAIDFRHLTKILNNINTTSTSASSSFPPRYDPSSCTMSNPVYHMCRIPVLKTRCRFTDNSSPEAVRQPTRIQFDPDRTACSVTE